MPAISALERLRQESQEFKATLPIEFKANLSYMRTRFKKKKEF